MTTPPPDDLQQALTAAFGVGPALRGAREKMGKTLPQCAEQLRIRHSFLQALEDGRHKDLPGGTYAVGFLRSYAEFLNLDGEEMVRRFRAEGAGDFATRAQLMFPSPVTEGRIPGGAVIFLGVILAAVSYGAWYWLSARDAKVAEMVPSVPDRLSSMLGRQAAPAGGDKPAGTKPPETKPVETAPIPTPVPTPEAAKPHDAIIPPVEAEDEKAPVKAEPPKAADIKAPEPSKPEPAKVEPAKPEPPKTPDPPRAVEAEAPKPEAPPAQTSAVAPPAEPAPATDGRAFGVDQADARVVLRAAGEDCWVQVREMDGSLLLSRLLRKGDSYRVPNRPGLNLMVGNAGALEVTIDGRKGPSLGASGQVRRDIRLDPDKLAAGG